MMMALHANCQFRIAIGFLFWVAMSPLAAQTRRTKLLDVDADAIFKIDDNLKLCDAISRNDRASFEAMLNAGVDINLVEDNGMTPLFWALHEGDLFAFETLLEYGADPHVRLKFGYRVFANLTFFGDDTVLTTLIAYSSLVRQDFFAVAMKYIREPNQQFFYENAPFRLRNCNFPLLHIAAMQMAPPVPISLPCEAELKLLAMMGVDPNGLDSVGCNPALLVARKCGFDAIAIEVITILLRLGADARLVASDGMGLVDEAERQLVHKDQWPDLPKFAKVLRESEGNPEILMDYVDRMARSKWAPRILYLSIAPTHDGATTAIKKNDLAGLKRELDANIDSNVQNRRGATLLHIAYLVGNFEAFALLLERGASPDLQLHVNLRDSLQPPTFVPQAGESVLMSANFNPAARAEYFELALKYCKSPNIVDAHGRNILHQFLYFPRHGQTELLNSIIATGVDLNAKTKAGASACHTAARMNPELIPALVKAGADPLLQNRQGKTVAEMLSTIQPQNAMHRAALQWLTKQP